LGVAGLCALAAESAAASINAELSASLTPDRYGANTTLSFGFALATPDESAPT
jgi:hypothetical protein